ncbi:MAG: LysE family translocator [Rhodospirillaceae bacterium]|nr:LysE family translocator [Rhodospirillaceae bacterium]
MTFDQIIAFALFTVAAAGTPGPSNVLLTATGANVGIARGLPALLGVTFGMGLMMFVVAFGLGGLILDNPTALAILKWIGIAFLLWLSWKIATAGRSNNPENQKPAGFLTAAAFQWVNPKSWLVCASAAGTYLDAGSGNALIQALFLGGIFVLGSLPSCFPWLAFGAVMQRWLSSDKALRIFNISMGALLAASLILIVL